MPRRSRFFRYDPETDSVVEVDRSTKRPTKARWPMYSDAMGVKSTQVPEAREYMESLGVPTDFNSEGQMELRTPGHRRRAAEALQYYDRNSYGGRGDARRR